MVFFAPLLILALSVMFSMVLSRYIKSFDLPIQLGECVDKATIRFRVCQLIPRMLQLPLKG
jgi:hypothetical protein